MQFVSHMLKNQSKFFQTCFDKIFTYTIITRNISTSSVNRVSENLSIGLIQGLNWSAIEKSGARKLRTFAVIDDLYQRACEDDYFLNVVIAGRHRNIHLIALKHNLYQQAEH